MFLAYLTLDDVNWSIAQLLAYPIQVTVCRLRLQEDPQDRAFDAAIYDVDRLSPNCRRDLIKRLTREPLVLGIGVHGYSVSHFEAKILRRNDILVSRRLTRDLMYELVGEAWLARDQIVHRRHASAAKCNGVPTQ